MTTILEFLVQSLPIFIAVSVPGYLLAIALLRKMQKFNSLELFFIGLPLGMFVPAVLGFLEFNLGISFTSSMMLINVLVVVAISLFVIYRDKLTVLPTSIGLKGANFKLMGAILIITFLAFWIRMQSLTPYFYDFDPYWYNQATQFLIEKGTVPLHDDLVWYPNPSTHRVFGLVQTMEAGWYFLYSMFNGLEIFNFEKMTLVSSLYPPIIAAVFTFFAYLWLSRVYNNKIGLIAAGFMAFTPSLVDKVLTGNFELTPFGFFSIIFFFSTFALATLYRSKRLALLTTFALALSLVGSASGIIPALTLTIFLAVLTLAYFFLNDITPDFLKMNATMIVPGVLLAVIMIWLYLPVDEIRDLDQTHILPFAPILSLILATTLYYMKNAMKNTEDRLLYLSVFLVLGLILILITPLRSLIDRVMGTVLYVTTYTDPTLQTIAEQTRASIDFSYPLGVLGTNFGTLSMTPVIIIVTLFAILFALYRFASKMKTLPLSESEKVELEQLILFLIGLFPVSLAGFFKAKFVVFTALMVPIIFCVLIAEFYKIKKYKIGSVGLAVGLLLFVAQAAPYYGITLYSTTFAAKESVENNPTFNQNVCNKINEDLQSTFSTNSPQFIKEFVGRAQSLALRIYCSRMPDFWIDAMTWIKENVGEEERIFSWWDYGHWTNSFGQKKSVTGNTHEYTIMHQEVADKLVHDTPESLVKYMKEHRAKYLLLDQDLIGKWGALVYHSCFYNNKTTIEKGPGNSECDALSYAEQVFAPKNPTSNDLCKLKRGNVTAVKIYSSLGQLTGFNNYCYTGQLPLLYENGSVAGITNLLQQGEQEGFAIFMAIYGADATDKKGSYYESVFYKGFFEGNIPGFVQVYPNVYSNKPDIPVRIYKIKD